VQKSLFEFTLQQVLDLHEVDYDAALKQSNPSNSRSPKFIDPKPDP